MTPNEKTAAIRTALIVVAGLSVSVLGAFAPRLFLAIICSFIAYLIVNMIYTLQLSNLNKKSYDQENFENSKK